MSKIEEFLQSLGSTSEEVADTLMSNGIHGRRYTTNACPIANAIYDKFPGVRDGLLVQHYKFSSGCKRLGVYGYVWHEASDEVAVTWDDVQTLDPTCPPAVKQFVIDFDNGKYPQLSSTEVQQ